MTITTVQKPFVSAFLKELVFTPETLSFQDQELIQLDQELVQYEQVFLNPEIEQNLISKNELLASFAISKAENSSLTLKEAEEVYKMILNSTEYDFVAERIRQKIKLTQKDYEKLEFFNIARTFRSLNVQTFSIHDLTPTFIKTVHFQLTQGMDIFNNFLSDFTLYKSGKWRDNDTIRVGEYAPPSYKVISAGVIELVQWLKMHQSVTAVAVFHTALYALHPFHNGNKRVLRILEHILLRQLGLNAKNLYSTSYYYHKEKERYYKYLLYSMERKNLNHFVAFIQEALVLSIISVVKTSLESKRNDFLVRQNLEESMIRVLKPLLKRREIQFKNLFKAIKGKMARQTFVNNLQKATELGVLIKREEGRATYYRLNITFQEEVTLESWITLARKRLPYIPDSISLV